MSKTKNICRIDTFIITDPDHNNDRYVIIDDDGDIFIADKSHGGENGQEVYFRRDQISALIKALERSQAVK